MLFIKKFYSENKIDIERFMKKIKIFISSITKVRFVTKSNIIAVEIVNSW